MDFSKDDPLLSPNPEYDLPACSECLLYSYLFLSNLVSGIREVRQALLKGRTCLVHLILQPNKETQRACFPSVFPQQ